MITPEERQSIVDEAVEKALLALPDVWSNLVVDHKAMSKLTSKFYKDNPEFADHKDAVVSVLADLDEKHPTMPYDQKIGHAVQGIQQRIAQIKGLDTTINPKPDLSFQEIKSPSIGSNGEL